MQISLEWIISTHEIWGLTPHFLKERNWVEVVMKIGVFIERIEDGQQVFSGFGLDDYLPGIAGIATFVEGWHGWGN